MVKKYSQAVFGTILAFALDFSPIYAEVTPKKLSGKATDSTSRQVEEIEYRSTADGTNQPAMFYAPQSEQQVPLLVALHTWSGDYRQKYHQPCEQWCQEKGWAYIHPNFRGPNRRPEATGSDLVVQDIVDAVHYASTQTKIDPTRIYLLGSSGGGYASLLMAGRHPEIWAAVSAWVPISDLAAWYDHCKKVDNKYWHEIAASCGGSPGESKEVDQQYTLRSPLTYLANARGVALDINAGIHDGHTGSVPVSHSLHAFNRLVEENDRFTDSEIIEITRTEKIPVNLQLEIADPHYGDKQPLLRRSSGNVRVTLFEGGHEFISEAALHWLQSSDRKEAVKP